MMMGAGTSAEAPDAGLPMMEGAIAADQLMWFSSRNSSDSAICFSLKPPT
jgi:hypothetical protein